MEQSGRWTQKKCKSDVEAWRRDEDSSNDQQIFKMFLIGCVVDRNRWYEGSLVVLI